MRVGLVLSLLAGAPVLFARPYVDRPSVADMGGAVGSAVADTGSLVLSGAHGHPLQRLTEEGHFTAWVGGDLGADNYGNRDGNLGVGEMGGGYNFGPVQLNLALGATTALQHTLNDGKTRFDGTYVVADAIGAIPGTPLVGTLTGFGQWADIDTTRVPTFGPTGHGSTDSQVIGGAARVDWVNAWETHAISFTPYVKLTAAHSRVDGYTETGAPVTFDSTSETLFEQTLGVNIARQLTKTLTLTGTIEGIHRFEGRAPSVDGTSFINFSLPGESYRQNWLRGAVGLDYAVSKGVFSVSLNATTEGEAPNAWLATSYQIHF